MPYSTKKIRNKWRVVLSANGKIALNRAGTPINGGGFTDRKSAVKQVQALNLAERRREGRSAPPMPRPKKRKR